MSLSVLDYFVPSLPLLTLETKMKPESLESGDEGGVLRNRRRREPHISGPSLCWPIHTCELGTGHALLVTIPRADLHWPPCQRGPTDTESSPTPSLESRTSGQQMHSPFNQEKWIPGPGLHHAELMLWKEILDLQPWRTVRKSLSALSL